MPSPKFYAVLLFFSAFFFFLHIIAKDFGGSFWLNLLFNIPFNTFGFLQAKEVEAWDAD